MNGWKNKKVLSLALKLARKGNVNTWYGPYRVESGGESAT
jgi:hypothetical protein